MYVGSADFLERDYELDLVGCVSRGWELLKNNFGLLFVAALIYNLIEGGIALLGIIPIIGPLFSLANMLVVGPLMGGLFYVFLQTIRGRPASAGDVFMGFRKSFAQLFLGYLIPALLAGLCLIPAGIVAAICILPIISADTPASPPVEVLVIIGVTVLVCLLAVCFLTINWVFALPLIMDKQMDFWTAMKTSWKMVRKHWWQAFGLMVLVGLLNVAGMLACCVGLLFTMPIGIGAWMYAYETIFSPPKSS